MVEDASVPLPKVIIGVVEETAREWVASDSGKMSARVMTATSRKKVVDKKNPKGFL